MGISKYSLVFGLAFALTSGAAIAMNAEPFSSVETTYYTITGKTGRELKRQMRKNSPTRYWGYTRWNVHWTSDCDVAVKIKYTFPRIKDRAQVPLILRKRFDKMVKKLIAHEHGHGDHGFAAAREIIAANCKGAKSITSKWAQEDKAYDKATDHGRKQGVWLED